MFHIKLHSGLRFKLENRIFIISRLLSDGKVETLDETFDEKILFTQKELIKQLDSGNLHFEIDSIKNKDKKADGNNEFDTSFFEFEKHKDKAIFRLNVIKPLIIGRNYLLGAKNVDKRVQEVNSYENNIEKAHEIFDSSYFKKVSRASIYRWVKDYEASNQDIRALIPGYSRSGGKNKARCSEIVLAFINEEISNFYFDKQRVSMYDLYINVVDKISDYNEFAEVKIDTPSYVSISRYINAIPEYALIANRFSKKTADNRFKQVNGGVEVKYPLERVEIDGTPLDLIITDEDGDVMPKPVFIAAIDKLSRSIVGFSVSFGGEGWEDVMLCIRHILMDKSYVKSKYTDIKNEWKAYGVPQTIVVDNGLGFKNNAMKDAAYQLGIDLQFCPVRMPQWKGSIERFMRTSCTGLVHKLPGTTRSNFTQLSNDENPSKDACIPLSLFVKLLHKWIIDIYLEDYHKGAGGIPSKIWAKAVQTYPVAWPNSIQELPILLGKVEYRQIRNTGIELMNLNYNSAELNKLYHMFSVSNNGLHTSFKVKYDPFNIDKIYIYDHMIENKWIQAQSVNHQYTENLTEIEHRLACKRAMNELGNVNIVALAKAHHDIVEEVNNNIKNSKKNRHSKRQKAKFEGYNSINIILDSEDSQTCKSQNVLNIIDENVILPSNENVSDIGIVYKSQNTDVIEIENNYQTNVQSKMTKKISDSKNESQELLMSDDYDGFEIIDDF